MVVKRPARPAHRPPAEPTRASTRTQLALAALVVVLFGALIGYRLFVPPIVGIADNGDFDRVACPAGLHHPDSREYAERYFYWINRSFEIGEPEGCQRVFSSGYLAAVTANGLNGLVRAGAGDFDVRFVGLVYTVLLIAGLVLLVLATRRWSLAPRLWLVFLLALVVADIGYVVYLNSFYGEAAALVALLLTAGLFVFLARSPAGMGRRAFVRLALVALLTLANLLLVASKPQNVVLAAPALILGFWAATRATTRPERITAVVGLMLLPWLSFLLLGRNDPVFARANLFEVAFSDLVKHSPDQGEELRRLGLPEKYERYVGMRVWDDDTPVQNPEFAEEFDELSYGTLVKYYLRHPGSALADLRRSSAMLFDVRVQGSFGHFERGSGHDAMEQSSSFALWSEARERAFPRAFWFLVLFVGVNVAVLLVRRLVFDEDDLDRGLTTLHLWVLALAVLAFVSTALMEGSYAPRHMFLANLGLDLCWVFLAMNVVGLITRGHRAARQEAR